MLERWKEVGDIGAAAKTILEDASRVIWSKTVGITIEVVTKARMKRAKLHGGILG